MLYGVDIYSDKAVEKLNNKESKIFFYKLMKLNSQTNFDFRLILTLLLEFNETLKKYYKWINISNIKEEANIGKNNIFLSIGSLISQIRDYCLLPVKNQICDELLINTALVRD